MKKFVLVFILLISVCTVYSQKIYKDSTGAHQESINVFVTSDSLNSDLNVFLVDSSKYVSRDGLWYYVTDPIVSDVKVKFVSSSSIADMKIYFVNRKEAAGWINKNKRVLF